MKQNTYNVINMLKDLPFEKLEGIAKQTNVDFKTKKLQAMRLFLLMLDCFLRTSKYSQRLLGEDAAVMDLQRIYGVRLKDGRISHSSISERLKIIKPEFFKESYELLLDHYSPIFEDENHPFELKRVDSTLVAETANKLKIGFATGTTDKALKGVGKKQIKYTMVKNDFAVTLAQIFDKPADSNENIPLSSSIIKDFAQSDGKPSIYLFDRGLDSSKLIGEIDSELRGSGSYFIGRIKINRKYDIIEDLQSPEEPILKKDIEIISDQKVILSSDKDGKDYRLIKIRFLKPRPRNAPAKSHRKRYDKEMLLLTDNYELTALEIVDLYKQRWDIEVFYKFLKQNLSFAHFISTSENGIQVVLYMTLITALLIRVFEHFTNLGPKLAIFRMENQIILWMRDNHDRLENCKSSGGRTNNDKMERKLSSDH